MTAPKPSKADLAIRRAISDYRHQRPGTSYAEAARAICFDEPWAGRLKAKLALLAAPSTTTPYEQER